MGIQAAAFLAVQSFNKKEWLGALDSFMNIKRENPHSPLNWLFHYGIAESLYQIKQSEQAKAEYEWVSKNAPKPQMQAEAAFKMGDVYFVRNQFAMAIQSYSEAIKTFSNGLELYPHVLMNLAESYFQLEEYKKSEETFARYLEIGRNQPNAWRASLRVAEIKSIHQKMDAVTENAFMDTINHYPMTSGSVIARLRLLPCGKHGGFDLAGAVRFLMSPEVVQFDGGEDLHNSSFRELVGLTEVRTLISFGEDESAIERGVVRLRENPTIDVRHLIEQGMIGSIKRLLERELTSEQGYAAIATYEKYGDYLPLPSHDPMADELRMKLAKFASEKKLSTFALKLIQPYRDMNEAAHREVLAAIEKNLSLVSTDETDERNYIEVKTLWNSDTFKIEDEKTADLFLTRLNSIRDESQYSWERDLLKALFYADQNSPKKNLPKALEIAKKLTLRLSLALNGEQKSQVWSWYGQTAQLGGDFDQAARGYHEARVQKEKVSEKDLPEMGIRQLKSTPSIAYLYSSEGEMLERQQKWKEAVALYTEAIENKIGGNHVLYAHARALLKVGGRDSKVTASRSLEKIKQSQDDDVWKNLAQKALDEIAKEGKADGQKRKPQ